MKQMKSITETKNGGTTTSKQQKRVAAQDITSKSLLRIKGIIKSKVDRIETIKSEIKTKQEKPINHLEENIQVLPLLRPRSISHSILSHANEINFKPA